MGLRCKALRRPASTRSEGSDRQLHTVSQVGAEELLARTGANNITMNVSNRWWWAAEEEVSVVHEEQLPWCDGSMKSMDDVRRTGVSATTEHRRGFPDPDSERGATTRWPVRLVILNGQHDDTIDPIDLEGQQKHIENEELQEVNGSRHSMMDLRSRTLRRLAGTRPKGRDRQLHRESQGRAENLLSGTSVHHITMTVSNNQWWAAEEVVSVVHEEQLPRCDCSIKNKNEESDLLSDREEDNCREDDNEDTPDSSQESVNEEVMRRSV